MSDSVTRDSLPIANRTDLVTFANGDGHRIGVFKPDHVVGDMHTDWPVGGLIGPQLPVSEYHVVRRLPDWKRYRFLTIRQRDVALRGRITIRRADGEG